jgi:predicted enzyme related to lactoylglutathione lyase
VPDTNEHRPSFVALQVRDLETSARFWLKADDPSALHDTLAEAGVAIVTPPFEGPFGLTFAFEDPDGYIITIHG